jgi:hypothetical protein
MRAETVVTASDYTTVDKVSSTNVFVTAPKFHKFMQMPKELRLIIWRDAIANESYTRPDGVALRYFSNTI